MGISLDAMRTAAGVYDDAARRYGDLTQALTAAGQSDDVAAAAREAVKAAGGVDELMLLAAKVIRHNPAAMHDSLTILRQTGLGANHIALSRQALYLPMESASQAIEGFARLENIMKGVDEVGTLPVDVFDRFAQDAVYRAGFVKQALEQEPEIARRADQAARLAAEAVSTVPPKPAGWRFYETR